MQYNQRRTGNAMTTAIVKELVCSDCRGEAYRCDYCAKYFEQNDEIHCPSAGRHSCNACWNKVKR